MAGALAYSLPEHWTELIAARKQRVRCASDIDALTNSCMSEHGPKHISQCPDHFRRAADRMFARYSENQDREWFSQRKAFIFGLESMFTEVKENQLSLDEVEANIESEKEAWYRWVLRRYPEFLAIADCGVDQEEVRGILDDPDRSREELVAMVWEAVGKPSNWSSEVDTFVDKVIAAGGDDAELRKLYVHEFFKDRATGQTLEDAQPYLDKFESDARMKLEDVISSIISANKGEKGLQARRDVYQSRLDELGRARTAFERDKALAKSRARASQAATVADELYQLPLCSVCQKGVDAKDVLSCPICQIEEEKKLTVYCSEECYRNGQEEHVEKVHDCEAGNQCIREGDEDEDMEDGSNGPVCCSECLEHRRVTLYCSTRCASQNLPVHRQKRHELHNGIKAESNGDHVQDLVTPLRQMIEASVKKRSPGLAFTWVD